MLLNYTYKGTPVSAYVLYNFKEVNDVALLITVAEKNERSKKTILSLVDGRWTTNDKDAMIDNEMFSEINRELSLISKLNEKVQQQKILGENTIVENHFLLLSGLCN